MNPVEEISLGSSNMCCAAIGISLTLSLNLLICCLLEELTGFTVVCLSSGGCSNLPFIRSRRCQMRTIPSCAWI